MGIVKTLLLLHSNLEKLLLNEFTQTYFPCCFSSCLRGKRQFLGEDAGVVVRLQLCSDKLGLHWLERSSGLLHLAKSCNRSGEKIFCITENTCETPFAPPLNCIHPESCAPLCAQRSDRCVLSVASCGLFWGLFWQLAAPMGAGDVSYPTTGDRRRKRAALSWRRSSSLPRCWLYTKSPTACTTTCRGSTTPTCSSPQRSSCCATSPGAACWRSPLAPGSTSVAWDTCLASPTASPKTTTTTSF